MATITELVEQHGFEICVVPDYECALPFIVKEEFLNYFRVIYEDGRVGFIGKELPRIDYVLVSEEIQKEPNWFWRLLSSKKD
jgi:hypothetical protein